MQLVACKSTTYEQNAGTNLLVANWKRLLGFHLFLLDVTTYGKTKGRSIAFHFQFE